MNKTSKNTFPPKMFEPYSSMEFTGTVIKNSVTESAIAIIVIIEYNTPLLEVVLD